MLHAALSRTRPQSLQSFARLLYAAESLDEGAENAAPALEKLVRKVLQSDKIIDGLAALLQAHLWTGEAFAGSLDLTALQADLWKLYGLRREEHLARMLVGRPELSREGLEHAERFASKRGVLVLRPVSTLLNALDVIASIAPLMHRGLLLANLSHASHLAIIRLCKMGVQGAAQAAVLRRALRRHGWNPEMYYFDAIPDVATLAREVSTMFDKL
jgi:hypothetical protein